MNIEESVVPNHRFFPSNTHQERAEPRFFRFCVDKLSVGGYKLCIILVTFRQISKYFL